MNARDDAPLLSLSGLSTWIDTPGAPVRAVDDVSLEVRAGETFALLGESGCGKSMTALSLMRLLPEAGRIVGGSALLDGRDLFRLTEAQMREVRGGEMAMIFQEPGTSLNPVMTAGRQICEVLERHAGLGGAAARARAVELLGAVGIPDAPRRLDEFAFQLSGGMKQRVMIAMALAGAPRLLIADEPTTALDVTIQAQVLDLLNALQRERHMAMLLITHDLGVVARMADRIGVMYAGELIELAERSAFFASPRHPYAHKLFAALPRAERRHAELETIKGSVPPLDRQFAGCRFAERCPRAFAPCASEAPAWTEIAAGHRVRCHLYGKPPAIAAAATAVEPLAPHAASACDAADAPLLEVDALAVHFPIRRGLFKRVVGHVRAVDGLSMRLARGRTLALVGESGCGKTTVGKAVLQLIRPSAGSVSFQGRRVDRLSARELRPLRAGMQMIFQDPYASLNPRMRVRDILAEGMAALGGAQTRPGRDARIAELLQGVGLAPDMAGRYPHEFSGGQRQRIAVARALAVNPRLLVCDEPTSALDVSVQAQILNLLKRLQQRFELSYLFITHNIAVVDYLADEVAVMYLGRIVEQGLADEVLRTPRHPYTVALLAAVPKVEHTAAVRAPVLAGDLPSPANPPAGCHFHPRCPRAMDECRQRYPEETALGATHRVRCHLY